MLKASKAPSHLNVQIITLVLLSLLAHVTLSGGKFASSLFALQDGYSEFIAGICYALYGLMPALLSLYLGKWVDRIGPRLIIRISLATIVVGLLLPALHLSLFTILLCAALSGLGFASFILAAHVSVSFMPVDNASDRTGLFAWLQMGTSVSAVLGPIFVGFIIDLSNFTWVYLSLAAIVFVGFICSFSADIPNGVKQKSDEKSTGILQDVFKDKSLLGVYLLSMSVYLAWDCFTFMIPVLGVERGYSASSIGFILSFFAVGTFLVRALLPWLSRRSTEYKTLCIASVLAVGVFISLPFANSIFLLSALSLVFGLSAGVGHPNVQNLIIRKVSADKTGEASGLRLMTGNISALIGTTCCGAVTALVGMLPVFLSVAAIMSVSTWYAASRYKLEIKSETHESMQ